MKKRKTWWNTIKKFKAQPTGYYLPTEVKQIQDIVRQAEQNGIRVRAVGSGHSFSDVAIENGYLLNIKKMKNIRRVSSEGLSKVYQKKHEQLIYAQAGITIQRLNKQLDKLDLCIENMGAVDEQTLAGAISTGTHGTGINLPAMSGMVRAILLVSKGGQIYRIEPKEGVVDRAAFEAQAKNKEIKLIQDDDWFHAALVNLGCFGIIYAYVIEVKPMYWLAETKAVAKWSEVKAMMESKDWRDKITTYKIPDKVNPSTGEINEKRNKKWKKRWEKLGFSPEKPLTVRSFSVIINPYKIRGKEDHSCLINRQILLPGKPRASRMRDFLRPVRYILLGSMPPIPFVFYWGLRGLNRMAPAAMPSIIERTVKSLRDEIYANRGHKVMFQGAEFIKLKAYDAEYAFDLTHKRAHVLNAIQELLDQAELFRQEGKLYQTSPIGMRFVQASKAFLTPESGRDVCYVDTPVLLGTQGADSILNACQDIFIRYNGIPHWGKINNRFVGRTDLLLKAYPDLLKWEAIFKVLNPNGTFSSDFSDRLGLGKLEDLAIDLIREAGYKGGSNLYKKFITGKIAQTNKDQ
ncbi:MAG: FAD-binding protein [Saprospiraceae bacterium]|nr:FAD-binding protein [Saprospiraceae bacterium]